MRNMTITQFIGYAKKFLVALLAALTILGVSLTDGVTAAEWVNITVAFISALGVYAVKNEKL